MDYLDTDRQRIFAHRGASGAVPENTIEAFETALREGAEILELDVHGTRDGHVVVIHDATLERTTDGSGPVREHTLEEILRLDAGYRFESEPGEYPFRGKGLRIPTLADVLERFPDTPLNIEVKQLDPPIEDAVIRFRIGEGSVVLSTADRNDGVAESKPTACRRVCRWISAAFSHYGTQQSPAMAHVASQSPVMARDAAQSPARASPGHQRDDGMM